MSILLTVAQASVAPSDRTIEILKIIVPAIASFLGALLAGAIAIYTARSSARTAHRNAIEVLRLSSAADRVAAANDQAVEILTSYLSSNRSVSAPDRATLAKSSVWLSEDVADLINTFLRANDDVARGLASEILQEIRTQAGLVRRDKITG